ncbi:hypothetical protein MNBD_NITROSPINAE01-536 [hydrothermal vent metagenome]|uniref:Uncharacterized protein n=1 Tax=hydrothermal vent metagenome TaxID=652676 RepID=A0A3B1CXD8_9ZZZZ
MATKKVTVVISEAPSPDVSERVRMTVGLTLDDDNEVRVLLIDDGIYTGLGVDHEKIGIKEMDNGLVMFGALGVRSYAHSGSVKERGVSVKKFGVVEIGDNEVEKLVSESSIIFA